MVTMEKNYEAQSASITASYEKQKLQSEQQFQESWFEKVVAFTQQEQDAETDYYKQRMTAARDYGLQAQRAEQDHQKEMLKLQRDHADKVSDLVADRDAMGLMLENRKYQESRQDAEDAYNTDRQRAIQDYQTRMSDMEQAFREQRQRAERDFQQQMALDEKHHTEAEDQAYADYQDTLTNLKKQNADEIKAAQDQYAKDLKTIQDNFNTNSDALKQSLIDSLYNLDPVYYAWLQNLTTSASVATQGIRQLTSFLNSIQFGYGSGGGGPAAQSQDAGGYMRPGIYANLTGGDEYALDRNTTAWMERTVGGKLTQQSIVRAMSGRDRSSGSVQVTFNSKMTSQDKGWVKDYVDAAFNQKFVEAVS